MLVHVSSAFAIMSRCTTVASHKNIHHQHVHDIDQSSYPKPVHTAAGWLWVAVVAVAVVAEAAAVAGCGCCGWLVVAGGCDCANQLVVPLGQVYELGKALARVLES